MNNPNSIGMTIDSDDILDLELLMAVMDLKSLKLKDKQLAEVNYYVALLSLRKMAQESHK